LTPPAGPVAPTMKTLIEVEPRIIINSVNTPGDADSVYKITAPGSYYLIGNMTGQAVKHGIEIATGGDVTIDLMGFELVGGGGTLDGIFQSVASLTSSISISNGVLRSWGRNGINVASTMNGAYDNLRVNLNNGSGMIVAGNSRVSRCGCAANGVQGGGGDGVVVGAGSSVSDCSVSSNVGSGIRLLSYAVVRHNVVSLNGGSGVLAVGTDNRVEANQIFGNVIGLNVDGINNYIADNTVRENTDNYDFAAGNQLNLLLCEIPETIAWPATVKLAGSLIGVSGQGGIVIDSGNVTIDLAGHALIGVPNSNDGISVGGLFTPNITIRNGSVQSWGGYGIRAHQARNLLVVDVLASGNGDSGIWGGFESTIDRCAANSNGFTGFLTQLNSRFINCTAANNVLCGFTLDSGSTITGCTASDNGLAGITATSNCYVANNNCENNDTDGNGNGIVVKGTDSRIEANNVTGNTIGIDVNGTSNLIIRNSASGNGTAYSIVAGNSVGPLVTSANIATNSNPHANYDY
jgi:hypothetical protein